MRPNTNDQAPNTSVRLHIQVAPALHAWAPRWHRPFWRETANSGHYPGLFMVKRIKKPSTPSNYASYEVDHHTNLSQQTEERWLQSVIINSGLVFNRRSFSILMGVRSPATRAFCCCASSMRNWRSRKNLPGFSTIG